MPGGASFASGGALNGGGAFFGRGESGRKVMATTASASSSVSDSGKVRTAALSLVTRSGMELCVLPLSMLTASTSSLFGGRAIAMQLVGGLANLPSLNQHCN